MCQPESVITAGARLVMQEQRRMASSIAEEARLGVTRPFLCRLSNHEVAMYRHAESLWLFAVRLSHALVNSAHRALGLFPTPFPSR